MAAGNRLPVIAITAGEPAGIGPELSALLASENWPAHLVIVADRTLVESRIRSTQTRSIGRRLSLPDFSRPGSAVPGASLLHLPLKVASTPGKLDSANSRYVLATLQAAVDGCRDGAFHAMVTAPVHKGIINDARIPFTGHTEFLAEKTNTDHVVMMLVGGGLRVALATTHVPFPRCQPRSRRKA
jgi:4-hydroxythreonine-4-phosphate dehydrogenase